MHTVPMERSNIGHCGWIAEAAYGESKSFTSWLRPNPTTFPDHVKYMFTRHLKGKLAASNQWLRVMVADDNDEGIADGTIIGFAGWARTFGSKEREGRQAAIRKDRWTDKETLLDQFERWALNKTNQYHFFFNTDPGYDLESLRILQMTVRVVNAKIREIMEKHSPTGGYIWLGELCVDPKFQGRGAGKRMVQQGIRVAEQEGVPIGLLSSTAGNKLYKSVGFKVVGTDDNGPEGHEVMIYWPTGIMPPNVQKFEVLDGSCRDIDEFMT